MNTLGILVTGSRDYQDKDSMWKILDAIEFLYRRSMDYRLLLIEGEQRGADLMAKAWAIRRGVDVYPFNADWTRFGKGAGHVRNEAMVDYLKKQKDWHKVCLAFKDDFDWTLSKGGTEDCFKRAKAAGIASSVWNSAMGTYLYWSENG